VDEISEQSHEIPQPPWRRLPDRPARRRRDPISRDAIVDTAIRLLDAEGLDGLSMRRIADELGTGPASLYWHVGSKDGLLDLVFDRLIGEVTVPEPEPGRWREQLKDVARSQRAASLRHPYVVRISIGRIPMGPNALRYSERVLAILASGGLAPKLAVQGSHLLIATVNGFTLDETGVGDDPTGAAAATQGPDVTIRAYQDDGQGTSMIRDYMASLPPQLFPTLVAMADEYGQADPEERFELLIDIFVDGLARRAASAARAARAPSAARAARAAGAGGAASQAGDAEASQ
jgi:AcrR family transcriptional regulator